MGKPFDTEDVNILLPGEMFVSVTLISARNPAGNTTSLRWSTQYEYDLAGNLVRMQTENLMNTSNTNVNHISYLYDYANRITEIILPDLPNGANPGNVFYEYGGPGVGNGAGRLIYK